MKNSTASSRNNNLRARIFTSLCLIPIIFLAVLFFQTISFGVVSAFIILLAGREWPKLLGKDLLYDRMWFICGLIIFMGFGLYLIQITGRADWLTLLVFSLTLFMWMFFAYWVWYYEQHGKMLINNHAIIGFLILTMCWLALNIIRNVEFGKIFVLYLLVLIWGVDSVAYFSGKRWGKKKLVPRVSPNKTWEGIWGALIFSLIFSVVAALLLPLQFHQKILLIPISLVVSVFSIVGDLSISVFKRQQRIKDTSTLLPGHGGLLDRIDSLIAAAPIFALGLLLLGLQQ